MCSGGSHLLTEVPFFETKNRRRGRWPAALLQFLFRVLDDLGLPQDVDLDLTGVLHFLLDLLGQVPGQDDHLVLADLLGPHHDPHLAAGLDGIGLIHAGIGAGDGLQLLQTLDVVLQVLPPGAGAAAEIASAACTRQATTVRGPPHRCGGPRWRG